MTASKERMDTIRLRADDARGLMVLLQAEEMEFVFELTHGLSKASLRKPMEVIISRPMGSADPIYVVLVSDGSKIVSDVWPLA